MSLEEFPPDNILYPIIHGITIDQWGGCNTQAVCVPYAAECHVKLSVAENGAGQPQSHPPVSGMLNTNMRRKNLKWSKPGWKVCPCALFIVIQ